MPAVDLVSLVAGLWSDHEENTARLLEHQAYALQLTWQDRTVDPDDPEVRARRDAAEAAGISPPPRPLVEPVAHRPGWWQWRRFEEFADAVEPYRVPDPVEELNQMDNHSFLAAFAAQFG